MRAPDARITLCPPAEASPDGTPSLLRQCQQCGQPFTPQRDEWECPDCIQEWREYLALRRELAYPGVWM